MPFKNLERKREYNRERLRKLREKEIQKEVDSGNINFGLGNTVKVEEKPKVEPSKKDIFGVEKRFQDSNCNSTNREQPFDMNIKSLASEDQRQQDPEGDNLGANMWESPREDPTKPKKKTIQDRLREFSDHAE
jgi:hypothetical protein